MFLTFFLAFKTRSSEIFSFFNFNESPKTIFLEKDQALMIISYWYTTLQISIPEVLSSPRYICLSYNQPIFYYFNNSATIQMHFSHNISFYTFNISNYTGRVSNQHDFLSKHFPDHFKKHFEPQYRLSLDIPFTHLSQKILNLTNVAVSYIYHNMYFQEIKNFNSQPPFSLKIFAHTQLLSNATVEADFGFGKQRISHYNFTSQPLPFETKFYITYKLCESVFFKSVFVDHYNNNGVNVSVVLKVDDIPESCHQFSAFVSVSSRLPWFARVKYRINGEKISSKSQKRGSEFSFARNFKFNVTFYVKYSKCEDFSAIKTVTVDDPHRATKIKISREDIPTICTISNQEL